MHYQNLTVDLILNWDKHLQNKSYFIKWSWRKRIYIFCLKTQKIFQGKMSNPMSFVKTKSVQSTCTVVNVLCVCQYAVCLSMCCYPTVCCFRQYVECLSVLSVCQDVCCVSFSVLCIRQWVDVSISMLCVCQCDMCVSFSVLNGCKSVVSPSMFSVWNCIMCLSVCCVSFTVSELRVCQCAVFVLSVVLSIIYPYNQYCSVCSLGFPKQGGVTKLIN